VIGARELLEELSAVLRPGAPVVVRVPDYRYTKRFPLTGRLQRKPGEHHLFFTPDSLAGVLERAGLRCTRVGSPLSTASLITPAVSLLPGLDPDAGGVPRPAKRCALAAVALLFLPLVLWRRMRGLDPVIEAWAEKG
jgi:hypothetical protein